MIIGRVCMWVGRCLLKKSQRWIVPIPFIPPSFVPGWCKVRETRRRRQADRQIQRKKNWFMTNASRTALLADLFSSFPFWPEVMGCVPVPVPSCTIWILNGQVTYTYHELHTIQSNPPVPYRYVFINSVYVVCSCSDMNMNKQNLLYFCTYCVYWRAWNWYFR